MKFKFFLTLLIFCEVYIPAFPNTPSPNDEERENDGATEIIVEQKTDNKNNNRHRMPKWQNNVTCLYYGSLLYITFEQSEGHARLNIYDLSGQLCDSQPFPTSTRIIYQIGIIAIPLRIEIVTSHNTYEGWLNPL